ncbi:type II toxin-antitoxin system YhaV family toxin [Vibrio fluvialis]|uniref:type II toxin-antitoxin system YhaV family toxin n=1 Tax=Vibrio fluvialis TaxID=676 RepID=UPI001C9C30D4|nr:type II toxin-antitoxin system YhaV family toxin [Vibrio fluvialis]MBY7903044.1 type II toxin-antitoxin system YhaV family toxin [Vibrio fluvialis]MBY7939705.1 type II toxin-antitoxin system YhaV family toxin [Vibrio fluvialis]MBY8060511.1 type II toxin-antitoxin system YhaV family toxin [Vibrio fluvialis]MBY8167164.1 type II toxin-antitoxin system YhaV family toxin [Vibrio fluvialis]WPK51877.1 type II toxin-antitoxin system YhaV family toxin [Vibrio fluvialis]
METKEVPVFHGYELHALAFFQDILTELTKEVEQVMIQDPVGFFSHPKYKLLVAVVDNITENVPNNPDNPDFRQGLTLGKKNKSWRRVKKKDLPPRYRLFFQFSSKVPKTIIYAWMNDETTQRKAGARTDVYAVFEKMLKGGKVPNTWAELCKAANPIKGLTQGKD